MQPPVLNIISTLHVIMMTRINYSRSSFSQDHLAHEVPRVPFDTEPPERLHGQRDEADDGVGQAEVEHQVVHISAGLGGRERGLAPGDHQGHAVQNYPD